LRKPVLPFLLLDPRTEAMPSSCIVRAIHSPSRLALISGTMFCRVCG
jgi:hypothetical protein